MKRNVLIIDDDEMIQLFLKKKLASDRFTLHPFTSALEGFETLISNQHHFHLVLCDLKMPEMDGIELLSRLKKQRIEIPVILMTAHGSLESALDAMHQGAFDYILKPLNLDELSFAMEKAFRIQKLESDNQKLRSQLRTDQDRDCIIGKSQAIQNVFDLIQRVAPTHANVLIQGESGTGKELVARALHRQSTRHDQPFIAINCSAIPNDLLESELFGHAKGSFTGAHQAKKGLFEEAQHGTLFLDEIGDMDLALQAKLLRVIQERKIRPVGEVADRSIDVRIVAATHKNLRKAAQSHQFREDLYYRLCVIPIDLPPLRQRKEDIPILAQHFVKKHVSVHGLKEATLTSRALSKLLSYPWPGNVRELENIIERSLILARSSELGPDDIQMQGTSSSPSELIEDKASKLLSLDEMEKHYISLILDRTDGKKEKASQVLGIDRKTLRRKIKHYNLFSGSEPSDLQA